MSVLISYKETGAMLKVSYDTIRRMVADGRLHPVEVGKRKKIKQKEITEIITGKDKSIINLASKLACAGYSATETAQIIELVSEII